MFKKRVPKICTGTHTHTKYYEQYADAKRTM